MANGNGQAASAPTSPSPSRPWWAPDAQGFVIAAVVIYVGIVLFYRMTHPAEINDKLLDMMLTILFGTAFVGIINFVIGSSRGSQAKDDTQNKIMEKLTATAPPGPPGPVSPVPAPIAVVAWWSKLTDAERAVITAAAANDPKAASFMAAAQTGVATADDLTYLVSKNLLTTDRADAIKA